MNTEITTTELDAQYVALLPQRETLAFDNNWASIYASNSSLAVNAGSFFSDADSSAYQSISVYQG